MRSIAGRTLMPLLLATLVLACGADTSTPETAPGEPSGAANAPPASAGMPLPKSFPQDLPPPDGAKLISAYAGDDVHTIVAYESDRPVEEVTQELEQKYRAAGWDLQMSIVEGDDGLLIGSKGDLSVISNIRPQGKGSRIDITAMKGMGLKR